MNLNPAVGYIFFENEVAIPSHYNINMGQNVRLELSTHVIEGFGLVLPLMRIVPDGDKITKNYFEQKYASLTEKPLFITLDSDNYVNEYYISSETKTLESWPYPKMRENFIITNTPATQLQLNRNLEKVYSIDSALMQFEKVSGIPAGIYTIYNRQELAAYIKNDIPLEEITSRQGSSQYEFVWLGE